MELLGSLWSLVAGLGAAVCGLLTTLLVFGWDVLSYLHYETPRLEGLLVGVLLAWLMARRDKHPLLRAASAPLKLVLDILDLAWDQVVEVVGDVYNTGKDWALRSVKWSWGKITAVYGSVMSRLNGLKDKLSKKESE